MSRNALALAFALLVPSSAARAGVVMELTAREPGEPQPQLSKVWIGADRVRIESGGGLMIFRGDKEVLWIVDGEAKTYMELTKDGGIPGMAEAMKEMQAEMASMSPEERAMVEAMMKQHGGGMMPGAPKPEAAPIAWKANGTADSVGGHGCKGHDGTRGGRLEMQICATDWAAFGLSPSDFDAMKRLAEFMKAMTGPMGGMAQQAASGVPDADFPGVPVRSVFRTPEGDSVHELTKLEKADVASAMFELPAGVTRESMDGGPAGSGPARRRR